MKNLQSNWLKAFEYSLMVSLTITVVLSLIFSLSVFSSNHEHYYQYIFEFIVIFFGLILYVGLGSLLITIVATGFIGVPTIYILKQLEIPKPIYAGLFGGLFVFLFMFASVGKIQWYFLFFSFYGFVSGYAFMHGSKKGVKK